MKQIRLGISDLYSSQIGIGTWGLGGPNDISGVALGWKSIPRGQAVKTIQVAIDIGINFFDCSDFYGRGEAERLLGETIPKSLRNIIIATKGGLLPKFKLNSNRLERNFSSNHIVESVEGSLKRLRRDCIDLYQLHGPDYADLNNDDTWITLERLRKEGKIRWVGLSLGSGTADNFWKDNLLKRESLISIQLEYNMIQSKQLAVIDSFGLLNCGLIARSPLVHGFLSGKYHVDCEFKPDDHRQRKFDTLTAQRFQEFLRDLAHHFPNLSAREIALRYVFNDPRVSITLVGVTSPEQVIQNVESLKLSVFDLEEKTLIRRLAEKSGF